MLQQIFIGTTIMFILLSTLINVVDYLKYHYFHQKQIIDSGWRQSIKLLNKGMDDPYNSQQIIHNILINQALKKEINEFYHDYHCYLWLGKNRLGMYLICILVTIWTLWSHFSLIAIEIYIIIGTLTNIINIFRINSDLQFIDLVEKLSTNRQAIRLILNRLN